MGFFNFLKKPTMPATMEDAMASQAKDFIDAFDAPGAPIDASKLNYSKESLALLDEVLEDFHEQEIELPEDLHFLASAYMFETVRREFGGRYMRSDDPNPFLIIIGEPEFELAVPIMEKVMDRATEGQEASLVKYYTRITEAFSSKNNKALF